MSDDRAGYLVGLGIGLGLLSAEIADEGQAIRAGVIALAAVALALFGALRLEIFP